MAEIGRIPVPLRLCRGCRRFVRLDDLKDCAFCGADLDAADAEHEANLLEMRQLAQELRDALARHAATSPPTQE